MAIKEMSVFFILILLVGCSEKGITGNVVENEIPTETGRGMGVYFCPKDDCETALIEVINSSSKFVQGPD
jgi:hypothetical protein